VCSAGIEEWTTRVEDTDWETTGSNNIVILADGTFKFQSVTGGNLDDIGTITIDNGVTGTVTVYIARNPADMAGTDGAANVGSINLTNSHMTPVVGNLAELRITGDWGSGGSSVVNAVTGTTEVDGDISDDLTTAGNFNGDLTAGTVSAEIEIGNDLTASSTLNVGVMTGGITIHRWLLGDIVASSMTGNIILDTTSSSSVGGDITINSDYGGMITSSALHSGSLLIDGSMSGTIDFTTRDFSGDLTITGDLSGTVKVSNATRDLRGDVTAAENVSAAALDNDREGGGRAGRHADGFASACDARSVPRA
jgi:hypothetical protein